MKSKLISLVILSIIFSVLMVSASVEFTLSPTTLSFTQSKISNEFTITNGNNEAASFNIHSATITDGTNSVPVSFNETSPFTLAPGQVKTIKATVTSSAISNLNIGTFSTTIIINASNSTTGNSSSSDLKLEGSNSFCSAGDVGELEIRSIDLSVEGWGDDEEWYLLDKISVEVDVKNTGNEDIDNVVLGWELINKDTGETILDDEENDKDIKDGDTETYTFTIEVDPDDFNEEDLKDSYALIIKAYSEDTGEENDCSFDETNVDLMTGSNFVILNNIEFTDSVPCGELLQITANAWNAGDEDQKEVSVRVYSKELGIDEVVELGDIDVLDSSQFEYEFRVPSNLVEKLYRIDFTVYDKDFDVYENKDDDKSIYSISTKIEGNCASSMPSVQISAELDSETPEAVAGKQVIIKATIKNTGKSDGTYTISTQGNSAWSSLVSINPQTLILKAGESEDVSIILDIDDDAEGDKEFTIKASSDGKTTGQQVALSISNGGNAGFDKVMNHFQSNWFIYVIVLINIILIIAIIAVVRSISRRSSAL